MSLLPATTEISGAEGLASWLAAPSPQGIISPKTHLLPTGVLSMLLLILGVAFIALNTKNLPFMWHMRIVNAFRFILRTQRPSVPLGPAHIFQPMITSSQAQLMEIDFNLHKTNSSYFSDVDIARTHLVCTLFAIGIEKMRGGTEAYTGSGQPVFGLALGAVSCTFKKELKPYEQYDMWSRILTWDEKWIYIVTHFVRKNAVQPRSYSLYPQQSRGGDSGGSTGHGEDDMSKSPAEKDLVATALSKCVYKSGRQTVSPDKMFRLSGLLPGACDKADIDGTGIVSQDIQNELSAIEAQRIRGLVAASQLASDYSKALAEEFSGADGEALGRHTDDSGIAGVANTLLQLAKLRKSQVL